MAELVADRTDLEACGCCTATSSAAPAPAMMAMGKPVETYVFTPQDFENDADAPMGERCEWLWKRGAWQGDWSPGCSPPDAPGYFEGQIVSTSRKGKANDGAK